MEPLYPRNILERTFPIFREWREKEERETLVAEKDKKDDRADLGMDVVSEEELYVDLPYEGGSVGKHLNTLA